MEVQVQPTAKHCDPIRHEINSVSVEATAVENINTITDLRGDQEEDEYIQPVRAVLKAETSVKGDDLPALSKILLRERKRLFFDDNDILWRKASVNTQVVLPLKYRDMIFKALHTEMGHLGSE